MDMENRGHTKSRTPLSLKKRKLEQMIPWLHFVIILFVNVITHSFWAEATTKSSSTSRQLSPLKNRVLLDLSNLPHLPAKTLATAIYQSHDDFVVQNDDDRDHDQEQEGEISMIDLSSSLIGDDGIQSILDAIFDKNNNNRRLHQNDDIDNDDANTAAISQSSSLRFRMNNLSPLGATAILQAIMSQQKNANTTTDIDTINSNNTKNNMEPASAGEEPALNRKRKRIIITSLDLSWNPLSPDEKGSKAFHRALQNLLSKQQAEYPSISKLSLDCCGLGPAACRAMGKGIVNCYATMTAANANTVNESNDAKPPVEDDEGTTKNKNLSTTRRRRPPPLSLSLCGNPSIGDAGAAALAAAIRTAATTLLTNDDSNNNNNNNIFEEVNLSGCDIGDAGAEALALALEDAPVGCCCVRHLNLSNNRITNKGAMAIGRALSSIVQSRSSHQGRLDPKIVSLDLSNNKEITDRGVSSLATALGTGNLQSLSLRSCYVYADGAALFGKALRSLMSSSSKLVDDAVVSNNDKKEEDTNNEENNIIMVTLDLSGNPLGILRGKKGRSDSKMGNGGGMYSASRIKSKATATAASYMNLLRKGLKDVGVDALLGGTSSTLESDDEADDDESKDNDGMSSKEDNDDPTKSPCGAKALADAFLGQVNESEDEKNKNKRRQAMCLRLGLRHCCLDHDAADALAALVVDAKDKYGIDNLSLDVSMNNVLEEDMVAALLNDGKKYNSLLREMSEKHMDLRNALFEAQQRAAEARAAAARARELESERQREAKRDAFFAFGEDDTIHDSDADYENDGEDDYY